MTAMVYELHSNESQVIPQRSEPTDFFDGNMFNPYKLAQVVMDQRKFVTFRDSKEICVYNPQTGVYEPNGDTVAKEEANKLLGEKSRPSYVNQAVEMIKFDTYLDRAVFRRPENYLIVRNGVLDIDSYEILPFNPNIYSLNALQISYVEGADCPKILAFLGQVVSPQDSMVLQEYAGYFLV